ncbi:hypothetical protein JXB01_04140 [Candidatus Micrarchaeota archaeon]|nr:hypothetical protein [Candidatus Micrarchaeota archaeon]
MNVKALLLGLILLTVSVSFAEGEQIQDYEIQLKEGWNLVSVPVDRVYAWDITSDCNCFNYNYLWRYVKPWAKDGYYDHLRELNGGYAYWYKSDEVCSIKVSGVRYQPSEGRELTAGWNAIGGGELPMMIRQYLGECQIAAGPFYYDTESRSWKIPEDGYIHPGVGYFVDISSKCNLDWVR